MPGATMSGLIRPEPSVVTGPRLLKPTTGSCPWSERRSSTTPRRSLSGPEPCCSSGPRSRQRPRRRCRQPACSRRLFAGCRARNPRSAGRSSCCSSRAAGAPDSGSAREVRRRHEELEALGVGRRRSVPLIHVPAADPLRSRSDADLVRARIAVVTRGRAVVCVPCELSSQGACVFGPQIPPPE